MLSPDTIVSKVYTLLNAASDKPAGLTILDHDMLPTEESDLPVCGVYLVEDKRAEGVETMGSGHIRSATIRLEFRAVGSMLTATQTYREWALKTLLSASDLNQNGRDFDYQGFQPFGVASNVRLAGADLDFSATYVFTES